MGALRSFVCARLEICVDVNGVKVSTRLTQEAAEVEVEVMAVVCQPAISVCQLLKSLRPTALPIDSICACIYVYMYLCVGK